MFVTTARILTTILLILCLLLPASAAPVPGDAPQSQSVTLNFIKAREAARILNDLIGAGELKKFTVDVAPATNTIVVRGTKNDIKAVNNIIRRIDIGQPGRLPMGTPQFKNIELMNFDAEGVAPTVKAIFSEMPNLRVAAGGKKTILLYATPEQLFEVIQYLQALDGGR